MLLRCLYHSLPCLARYILLFLFLCSSPKESPFCQNAARHRTRLHLTSHQICTLPKIDHNYHQPTNSYQSNPIQIKYTSPAMPPKEELSKEALRCPNCDAYADKTPDGSWAHCATCMFFFLCFPLHCCLCCGVDE